MLQQYLLITIVLFLGFAAMAQPPSRGRATEMIIAGDNSLQMLDIEKALDFYSSAISLDPGFADAYMKRANAYAIAGRNVEAQMDYNMALQINPYIDYLYDRRAKVKILVADFKGSLVDIDKASLLRPTGGDLMQGYVLAYLRGIFPTNINTLDSLINVDTLNSQNLAIRALARWETDDLNGAIVDAEDALQRNPTNAMALNIMGLLQLENGNYATALESFNAALSIDENFAIAYLNRGRTHLLLENHTDAILDMDKAISLDSNFTLAYLSRAMLHKGLGNAPEAITDYDKVIKLEPNLAEAFASRGFAKKMLTDYAGALRDYDRAIVLDPTDASAFNNRGILRVLADDFAGAAKDFRAAINLEPDYAVAYHNLGMSLIMNYSRTEGCEYLQTSISKGFGLANEEYKYFCTQ